jgi:hypothetical protein
MAAKFSSILLACMYKTGKPFQIRAGMIHAEFSNDYPGFNISNRSTEQYFPICMFCPMEKLKLVTVF